MGQDSSQIEIIALGYYDGATEGFALAIENLGVSYFKMIAWDDNQDKRLFMVVPVGLVVFSKVLDLLTVSNIQPLSKVWMPDWSFANSKDEANANKIVESCRSQLKSKGILVLGDNIYGDSLRLFAIADALNESVQRAMNEPENLGDWLRKLGVDKA